MPNFIETVDGEYIVRTYESGTVAKFKLDAPDETITFQNPLDILKAENEALKIKVSNLEAVIDAMLTEV